MSLNIEQMYRYIRKFDFASLFIKELHWSEPVTKKPIPIDERHMRIEIARVAGSPVFEISTVDGQIPNTQERDTLSRELSLLFRESILIFIDKGRTQSIWYWMKHDGNTYYKCKYLYTKGEPEDLFLSKITIIVSDLIINKEKRERSETSARQKLSAEFLRGFYEQRYQLMDVINGIENEQDCNLYTTILLNRLIFLYFLERRGFLNDGHTSYLEDHLQESTANNYYHQFLRPLFFEGLAKPKKARSHDTGNLLGRVPYLNGEIFGPCAIELRYPDIQVPNNAFKMLFSFFSGYNWQLVDIPSRNEKEMTPSILGNIFEMSFNQISTKDAFYTPVEVTDYLCRQTIEQVILKKINQQTIYLKQSPFSSIEDMLAKLDAPLCHLLLMQVLPALSILDPACETGTFLVGALNSLIVIYSRVMSRMNDLKDPLFSQWLKEICLAHPNPIYYLKKTILTNNLFGVDIREDAVEITRLRLFLALISSLASSGELEPLPHIGFNLRVGNSLIGLLRMNDDENAQLELFAGHGWRMVKENTEFLQSYRHASEAEDTHLLKATIEQKHVQAMTHLNEILLTQLSQLSQRSHQPGSSRVRKQDDRESIPLVPTIEDVEKLKLFHWCYDFRQIMREREGFDVIITNPPWGAPRPEDFTTVYYRSRQRAPIDLYKLFVERCYHLLSNGGYCGIIVPSSIYTDNSAAQLRDFLFKQTRITGLFSFGNQRRIFEGFHPHFKITLLTFEKGQATKIFPAVFAGQAIEELEYFPAQGSVYLATDFLRRFSPGTIFIPELNNQIDVRINERMLDFPLLGEKLDRAWNVQLAHGFSFSRISPAELVEPRPNTFPVYEGRMIEQFIYQLVSPRYWVNVQGKAAFSKQLDQWKKSGWNGYHLSFRNIVSSSNTRTLIATVLPPNVVVSNTITFASNSLDANVLLFLTAIFNSFLADYFIRQRVASVRTAMSYVYQLPVPRLTKQDDFFLPIVKRAARLICTTDEFKDLWKEIGADIGLLDSPAINSVEREQLRAELEGLITNLYKIPENEFSYILSKFPRVGNPLKIAAQNAYRDTERGLIV